MMHRTARSDANIEGPIAEVDIERIKQTFDTNVFGIIRTAKAVIPHMAARKSGTIVNIGSVVGEM